MSSHASILVLNVITVPISTSSESSFTQFVVSEGLYSLPLLPLHRIGMEELIPITFEYLTRSVLLLSLWKYSQASASVNWVPPSIEEKVNLKFIRKHSLLLNIIRIETQTTTTLPRSCRLIIIAHLRTALNLDSLAFIQKLKQQLRDVETKRNVFNETGFGIRQRDGNTT